MDHDLEDLRHHWDTAYVINRTDDGFVAQRRDNRETVRAATADEMHKAILADYTRKPVPR